MLAIEWEQGLNDAWARIATFVPKLLGFLVILVIGYFLAKALSRIVDGLLERVGFDRWVERGSLKTALERSRFDASDIIAVIVFWAVFLIALQLAFGIFGNNPVSDLIAGMIAYLPNVLVAVIILVIAAAIAKVVTEILSATLGSVQGGVWIARVAGMAILVLGVFAALNQLKIAPEIVNGLFYAILSRSSARRSSRSAVAASARCSATGSARRRTWSAPARTSGATPTPRRGGRPRSNGWSRSGPAPPAPRSTCVRRRCRWPRPPTHAEARRTLVAGPVPSGPATAPSG